MSIILFKFKTVSFLFSGGTLAQDSISTVDLSSNLKLHLFLFGWHTGTRLKYIVKIKFSTASLSFWVAHWHTTQVHCTARIQNCISLFLGGTLAHDQIHCTSRIQNCISLFLGGTLAHDQIHCTSRIQNCISLFLGGTLAHDSSILYSLISKLHLFLFG
jgi:hypothetical protein